MDNWQLPLAALVILGAVTYLARRTWRTLSGRKAGGCGGGCACGPAPEQGTLITAEQLTLRLRKGNDNTNPPV